MSEKRSAFDVRMKGFRARAECSAVVELIDSRVAPLPTESVRLDLAAGRRLSAVITSPVAVPAFARAAMDGYAVRGEDTFGANLYNELSLDLIGQSMPGQPFTMQVGARQAVRIMTGAPMPPGADAVLMAEHARESAATVYVTDPVPPGKNVGTIGEDIKPGEAILSPPRTLRPQDVAVCAAIGLAEIPVVRRPKVAILITGNELLPPGSKPEEFRIIDTNSVLLRALIERDGGSVENAGTSDGRMPIPIHPDDREAVRAAILQSRADCLLISGGSSVGAEDFAPTLVAELGELIIHGVAARPASPTGLGFVGNRPTFLMPGNPVSCLCTYDLFAGRAIRRLGGRGPETTYPCRTLPLRRRITSAIGRVDYTRVRIVDEGVEPIGIGGASVLSSTTRADGYVLIPADLEGYPAGADVEVHCYEQ